MAETCNPGAARTLLNGVKAVAGRVIGTPQSFLNLRSKCLAMHTVFGHYTVAFNLCPSELGAVWTFNLAGRPYTFDALGNPNGRPEIDQCRRIIAANPVACAQFFQAYITGFLDIFCGWQHDSDRQTNESCMFGKLHALYVKYECSGRGGLHCHGQALQPFLQTSRLQALFASDAADVQSALFSLFEAVACAHFPGESPDNDVVKPTTQLISRTSDGESQAGRSHMSPTLSNWQGTMYYPRMLIGTLPLTRPKDARSRLLTLGKQSLDNCHWIRHNRKRTTMSRQLFTCRTTTRSTHKPVLRATDVATTVTAE